MTDSIAPRSDQMNAEDLLPGPRTFTITDVKITSGEQPVSVYLAEFPHDRPFKPSKTVRRLMVLAWGLDQTKYTGRRMTLYRDPDVRFGGQDVGGIRMSHASGLQTRMTVSLSVTRGKRAPFVVEPLPDIRAAQKVDAGAGGHLEQRRPAAVRWFADRGIPVGALTSFVGVVPDRWDAAVLDRLEGIAKGINAGEISLDDAFPSSAPTAAEVDDSDEALDPDVVDPPAWREGPRPIADGYAV
jgi:hypothetical protein